MQNSRLISLKTKKLLNFKNSEREAAYHNFFFQNPRGAEPPPESLWGGAASIAPLATPLPSNGQDTFPLASLDVQTHQPLYNILAPVLSKSL